jgi:hypothetical protein
MSGAIRFEKYETKDLLTPVEEFARIEALHSA